MRDRGLPQWLCGTMEETGNFLLRSWRKLRMTWPVFCRFAYCRHLIPSGLTERWSNNWIDPGELVIRFSPVYSHCSISRPQHQIHDV